MSEAQGAAGDLSRLLIANRGEVAARVARAAADLGVGTVAVRARDDRGGHVRFADEVHVLPGRGVRAYLDADAVVDAATATGCDALHPGYGFLSERPDLAERCEQAGITFVGPTPATLETFGDKVAARDLASTHDVPVPEGVGPVETVEDVARFWDGLPDGAAVVVKARSGGGGRGIRIVEDRRDLAGAIERARSEAAGAVGSGALYVERRVRPARHVEAQILGDGRGGVVALGLRDCSLQRRRQKIVEIAPPPGLDEEVSARLTDAALTLAHAARFRSLGTVEFLVEPNGAIHFLEVNPRLQVEHTVTEEITGLDLVAIQLRVAGGAGLDELGLSPGSDTAATRGTAIQIRVNAEQIDDAGDVQPATGTIRAVRAPGGPGVRVDTALAPGDEVTAAFDPLLAKVVAWSGEGFAAALRRAARACDEFEIDGVATNLALMQRLLRHPDLAAGALGTAFVDDRLQELVAAARGGRGRPDDASTGDAEARARTGAPATPPDPDLVTADLSGVVVSLEVGPGEPAHEGAPLLVIESMKMEHVVSAPRTGRLGTWHVTAGDQVTPGAALATLVPADLDGPVTADTDEVDLDAIRPDLAEVLDRQRRTRDEARPDAVARRRRHDRRTARENLDDLVDPGTFVEYGSLALAAQRSRRDLDDLIRETPADGFVGGTAHVNGDRFDDERSRCAVMSYDYTVLAGTQGYQGHRKKDRLFALAERLRLPVVLFAEGGGGRPGDVDAPSISGLDTMAFASFARLSGLVPLVGIVSGRCFAGNAALLGCCDVIIATRDATIGMAGPAMIEGGGLGVYEPEEVGPVEVQAANGVIDVVAADDAEAVAVAKRYLAYFQGPIEDWECADQRLLRTIVPENRLRVYDVRRVISALADTDSTLELRGGWAPGIVTTLARIEGRPLGIVANDPRHLGGAIDADGADKAARFLQLCDAHGLPVVFLCDTPGFMVGPEAEKQAQVRHFARLFVVGAALEAPFGTVVLRKGYGLGAQAMAGGSFHASVFTVAWPTGEIGAMGLEGAVRLGFRKELAAAPDARAREELFEQLLAEAYERGKALHAATAFELDDVIDPVATRDRIVAMLRAAPPRRGEPGGRRAFVDTW